MTRKIHLALCILAFFAICGCNISGKVTIEGENFSGLTVVLSGDADMTTVTDDNGEFKFKSIKSGDYVITLEPGSCCTRTITKTIKKSTDYYSVKDVNFIAESALPLTTVLIKPLSPLKLTVSSVWFRKSFRSPGTV